MASAQVLPSTSVSSKKQEHLLAGKKRLEEFRKKKAAELAKKASSTSQLNTADSVLGVEQTSDAEHVKLIDSDGPGTSDGLVGVFSNSSSGVLNNDLKTTELRQNSEVDSSYDGHGTHSESNYNAYPPDQMQTHVKDKELQDYDAFRSSEQLNHLGYFSGVSGRLADDSATEQSMTPFLPLIRDIDRNSSEYSRYGLDKSLPVNHFGYQTEASGRLAYGIGAEQPMAPCPPSVRGTDSNFGGYNHYGLEKSLPNNNDGYLKDFGEANFCTSDDPVTIASPETSASILLHDMPGYAHRFGSNHPSFSYEGSFQLTPSAAMDPNFEVEKNKNNILGSNNIQLLDTGEQKLGNSVISTNSLSLGPSESRSTGFSLNVDSSLSNVFPSLTGSNTRRSRPSFLDSINVPIPSPEAGTEKNDVFNSKVHPLDIPGMSDLQSDVKFTVAAGNGGDLKKKHDFFSRKQDEDFAALEQHIEDLTQEKFSLQRALEASRTLVDSLAAENSSLTESYNQQASVVSQLRYDMEMSQEEIKAKLVEVESIKTEYGNVLMECNAAEERGKILASEVIGLEEKALRLRSSELKLQRQLENSESEISSFRKKISSLEKDRLDLQSTIDALQEEKKLLQSKLLKASATGKLVDVNKNSSNKRDMSTSTEDLVEMGDPDSTGDMSNRELLSTASPLSDGSSLHLLPGNGQLNFESLYLTIHPDQRRMIENINTLISELALEKEELVQSLSNELGQSSMLKELNSELSRKLEAQTQRLELLTAQSMVHDSIPARRPDSGTMNDNTPYADEGDEVVERVLGWIMKLFPGGPSRRRRTSKLL